MIVVDTDVLIEIFDKHSDFGEIALGRIRNSKEPFCTTAINQHELLYGVIKYNKHYTEEILEIPTLEYTKQDAELSSRLEFDLESKGRKIARLDTMIAAISINNSAKLYTNNHKHFQDLQTFGLDLF